jgi:DNA-binding NtrC family response regulator
VKPRILLVDDDVAVTSALRRRLGTQYEVSTAASAADAISQLDAQPFDAVISDELMGGPRGTDLLRTVASRWPETIRVMLTGHATLDTALRAINDGGVSRFLIKPCPDTVLAHALEECLRIRDLIRENHALRVELARKQQQLDELEQSHPGISSVSRDADGAVLIEVGADSGDR